jgi:hypothetical protein
MFTVDRYIADINIDYLSSVHIAPNRISKVEFYDALFTNSIYTAISLLFCFFSFLSFISSTFLLLLIFGAIRLYDAENLIYLTI